MNRERRRQPKREFLDVLVFSTAHITELDADLFERNKYPTSVAKDEYGWFVWIGPDKKDILKVGFSSSLIDLLRLANRCGATYIRLDMDGPVYEDLPTYDW